MRRNSIHFGTDVATGKPVFVPLDVFKQHMVIRGKTGALKSVYMTYLMSSVIEQTDSAIIFVDYGGDLFTHNVIKRQAEKNGRTFRLFSTGFQNDWDSFDPLRACLPLSKETLVRAASYLVTALSLHHGEGFSTSYFGDISMLTMQDTLNHCIDSENLRPSIKDFAEVTERTSKAYRKSDVAQAEMALRQLAPYPQLQRGEAPSREIRMDRAIESGEIIYGYLPGVMEPTSTKLGAFLAWSAILAAIDRVEAGLPKKDVYVVLEECSVIARSPSFAKALVLGRKYGVRLIMLHQLSLIHI